MPITRTIMTDDDGSGTTGTILNNAWLQTIYNQIDGVVAGPVLTWTPTGGGLGTLGSGVYVVSAKLVFASAYLTIPANSNAAVAEFSLPLAQLAGQHFGLVQSYGPAHHRLWINTSGAGMCQVLNGATGATRTFQDLSGSTFMVHGTYLLP